jgi:hypothetical protein
MSLLAKTTSFAIKSRLTSVFTTSVKCSAENGGVNDAVTGCPGCAVAGTPEMLSAAAA